jgi:hypothetical protein
MTKAEQIRSIPVNKVLAKDLKVGDHMRTAYSFVELIEVIVRAKTTKVRYKSLYDGAVGAYPWQFKNDEIQNVKIK